MLAVIRQNALIQQFLMERHVGGMDCSLPIATGKRPCFNHEIPFVDMSPSLDPVFRHLEYEVNQRHNRGKNGGRLRLGVLGEEIKAQRREDQIDVFEEIIHMRARSVTELAFG